MLQFRVYDVELNTKLNLLEKFLDDMFYKYYKKRREKNRFYKEPVLKVTDDIISAKFWVKTHDGIEKRMFLDGTVLINDVKIHTLTLDGEKFEPKTTQEFIHVLKSLSKISKGFLYSEVNHIPVRIEKGKVIKYNDLLEEIYNDLPEDKKKKHALSLDLLYTDAYGISF